MPLDLKNPLPLYQQITEDIKSKILADKLKENDSIGSLQELSKYYKVSSITIRKAISTLRNEGYVYSRMGKGTFVRQKVNKSELTQQNAIGLVLRDLRNPFFSLVAQSITEAAAENGFNILLSNTFGSDEKEEKQIRYFNNIGVTGLIIASMHYTHQATKEIRRLHQENFPYIMVSYVEDEDIFHVGTDHEYGAKLATEHLIHLGYKKIGYICGERSNVLSDLRRKTFIETLMRNNMFFTEDLIIQPVIDREWNHFRAGYEVGKRFQELSIQPDALFTYNDLCALGFQSAILERGLKIPDDVAIIGFDDIKRDVDAQVPLTTIHQPTRTIGEIAIENLLKRIKGEKIETRTVLKPKLIIRESCGAKTTINHNVNA